MSAPAGWYDDGSGRLRWFDGAQWTEHFHDPAPAAPVEQVIAQPVVETPVAQPAVADPAAAAAPTPTYVAPEPTPAYEAPAAEPTYGAPAATPTDGAPAAAAPAYAAQPASPYGAPAAAPAYAAQPASPYGAAPGAAGAYSYGAPAAGKRSGLLLAGGIIGVIRGVGGTLLGIGNLGSVAAIESFIPGYGILIGFELLLSLFVLGVGIWAIIASNKPAMAPILQILGFVVIGLGVVDAIWATAVVGLAAGTIGAAFGSIVALTLVGVLIAVGARKLAAQRA